MQLSIEKWVNENKVFDEAAAKSFNEAVMCYKVGAYQSAFIMSYLSFKLTIKQRIINFDNNSIHSFDEGRWENIIDALKNEDKWEERINQEVTKKETQNNSIIKFTNRDRIILDYNYWKSIRNSCVHAKNQIIDASTVECFWNYLKDNLSKFYVLGGHDYIKNEFLNCFRNFSIGQNYEKLNKILNEASILYSNNMEDFFGAIEIEFKNNSINLLDDSNNDIWIYILKHENVNIKEGCIKNFKNNISLIAKFYVLDHSFLANIIQIDKEAFYKNLDNFIECITGLNRNYYIYFLDIIYILIVHYDTEINIEQILKDYKYVFTICNVIKMANELKNDQLCYLKEKGVFNKILEVVYSWIFDVNAKKQRFNFSCWTDKKDEVKYIFRQINFDKKILVKLEQAIDELNASGPNRTNTYSIINYRNAKSLFETIIHDNGCNITKAIQVEGIKCNNILDVLKNT